MIPETEIVQEMPGPLELVSQAEQVGLTIAAMRTLPERQRSVLHLIACEELTVSETAEVLQITPEAVRSSLSLARCRMRLMLKPGDNMDQKNTILNEDNIS